MQSLEHQYCGPIYITHQQNYQFLTRVRGPSFTVSLAEPPREKEGKRRSRGLREKAKLKTAVN